MTTSLVNTLFSHVNLPRHGTKRPVLSKTLEGFLVSLGPSFKLTNEEKRMKTGLLACATANPVSLSQVKPPQLWVFPTAELEQELKLETPRKVQTFVPSAASTAAAASKSRENIKKARIANTAGGRAKRNAQAIDSSHYVSDETTSHGGALIEDALARKRSRLSSGCGGGGGGSGDAGGGSSDDAIAEDDIQSMTAMLRPLPANFYQVMHGLFSVFWEMDFADEKVSYAFFAKIDATNCILYGLETYATRASSLVGISERLQATDDMQKNGLHHPMMLSSTRPAQAAAAVSTALPYRSVEDFYTDFREMFDNIYRFYPTESPVQAKAKELDQIFKAKWLHVKSQFL